MRKSSLHNDNTVLSPVQLTHCLLHLRTRAIFKSIFPKERPKVRRRRCGPFLARGCRRRISMKSATSGGYLACGSKKLVLVIDESSKIFSAAEKKKNLRVAGLFPHLGSVHFRLASGRAPRQCPSVQSFFFRPKHYKHGQIKGRPRQGRATSDQGRRRHTNAQPRRRCLSAAVSTAAKKARRSDAASARPASTATGTARRRIGNKCTSESVAKTRR